jgi:hypothetical protein
LSLYDPPSFSPRYRAGWLDGVEYCLGRMIDGEPIDLVRHDALAVAECGAANFSRNQRRGLRRAQREREAEGFEPPK